MAESRLTLYALGSKGVILDPHHLLPGVPEEGLLLSQNMTHDPSAGFGGALRKRPGLARFSQNFGGVILGGIPMPIAGTGGAPARGGGASIGTGDADDGTSAGTGDMTGAPGGTFDGGVVTTTPPGAFQFNAGASVFGGARLIVVARLGSDATVSNEGGSGWYVSSKNLADVATKQIPPGPPAGSYSYPAVAPFLDAWGTPGCVDNIGTTGLYYAAAYGNQVTGTNATPGVNPTNPRGCPIRSTTGATDRLVATIPVATAGDAYSGAGSTGNIRSAITFMHYGTDGFIYVGVKDKYTGQDVAGSAGRVFRLNPLSGETVEWNMGVAGPSPAIYTTIPYCGNYFAGYLYVGEFGNVIDTAANVMATNGTQGVQDNSFNTDAFVSCLCQFNGRLFVGTGVNKTTPTLASFFSRSPVPPPGTGTGWAGHTFDASRTGNTTNGNMYTSMVVFNGALYAAWYAPSAGSQIYKVTADVPGDPTSISFTFTSVFSTSNYPYTLFVDDGVLYAIGVIDGSTTTSALVTTNGTSWTDRSTKLPTLATSSRVKFVLFGVNQ
jgi:hypothetical protein